jgi:hypothetical protein
MSITDRKEKKNAAFNLFDKIVAVPSGNLLSGDNSELSKGDYPKGYKKVEEYLAGADKGNRFIGSHNIDTAVDYCIVNDTEYILTSDNKVKRWGIINEETEEEGWIPIETFNRIGNKLVVSGTKIIFVYSDSDDDQSVNSGLAILETTTNILTKLPLWITAYYFWFLETTHNIMICNGYLTFGNNTAIPLNNLVAEALLTTTMQARAYCLGKYWSTDNMNAFISDTIDGEYSQTLTGLVERPSSYLALSETELFIHCSHFNSSKNYVYDGTNLTEKTAKHMDEIYYNQGYIFGFYGWEHKVICSSDKGTTWQEQDLGVEIKSIGCSADTESITVTTAAAVYFKVYDTLIYTDTITLTDTSTVTISYYKNGNTKICLPDEQATLDTVFADKGVLDYFVFDGENKYFKIPRANLPEALSSIGLQKCWYIN